MITTNDDALADRLRVLRNQGMRARYAYEMAGHNYRLTDLQAAVGIPQLKRYAHIVAGRKSNAARLTELLRGVPGIAVPRELPGRSHVWHQFTIRVTEDARLSRDEFVQSLHDEGIGSGVYYPRLLWDYDAYRQHPRVVRSEAPVAERVAAQVVSLPVNNSLSEEDLVAVASAVAKIAGA